MSEYKSDYVVWCDFGGVISPDLGGSLDRVAASIGVRWADIAAAADRVAEPMGLRGLQPLELGLIAQDEWADRVSEVLTESHVLSGSLRGFDAHWYQGRVLDQELLAGLAELRAAGVPVGMLTNSVLEWEPHRAVLLGEEERFDAVLRSHEVQLAKPDPAVFAHAETMLGEPAAVRLLIDDLEENCAGAEAVGWRAILHTDAATTLAELDVLLGATAGARRVPGA